MNFHCQLLSIEGESPVIPFAKRHSLWGPIEKGTPKKQQTLSTFDESYKELEDKGPRLQRWAFLLQALNFLNEQTSHLRKMENKDSSWWHLY